MQLFNSVYTVLWAQHHFPYYQIQSADIIQEPRVAADNRAYREALATDALRLCELTSSRYLLGLGRGGAAHLDSFYGQEGVFDERLHFGLGPKKQGKGRFSRFFLRLSMPSTMPLVSDSVTFHSRQMWFTRVLRNT